jgi:hypothetical protein
MSNKGQVLKGPVTIRGDLVVTGNLNKGVVNAQTNQGQALGVVQGVLQAVASQGSADPNNPQNGDLRMYGQNTVINSGMSPSGAAGGNTNGYFEIDEYINGSWQQLFEIQPSTTGNANVLDLFISGRLFARDSVLSAPGRFFFKATGTPFGASAVRSIAYGNGVFVAVANGGKIARSLDGGVTWGSLITNPFGTSDIIGIAYGNGVFVAGTSDSKIARSLDGGATWGVRYGDNASATVLSTYIYAIATDGLGHFVIGGYDTSNISIAYTDYVEAGAGIVESGSNSNGSYIKFADGTIMCYASLFGVPYNSWTTYNSPASAAPGTGWNITATIAGDYGQVGQGLVNNATQFSVFNHSEAGVAISMAIILIGRWK